MEFVYRNLTGTGRYVAELTKELLVLDDRNHYTLFTTSTYGDRPWMGPLGQARFIQTALPWSHKLCEALWLTMDWPPVDRYITRHDIYHCMSGMAFPARGGKYLLTVHDLSWQVRPEFYDFRHRGIWRVHHRRVLRRSDHFIAVSQFTKQDMMEHLQIPAERITVIPEGVRSSFRVLDPETVKTVRAKYVPPGQYFLVVGDVAPRKNNVRVVQAFARVKERSREPVSLVFAGPLGFRAQEVVREVRDRKLTGSVKFLGYTNEDDLVALMNGATALVFVSLYEGFGLPILEAMACDTPVVTSKVTSMPEVAGDAALLVEPTSEEEIADAMWQVLSDESTRRRLVEAGRRRVLDFTWTEAARRLRDLYERIGR